MSSSNASSAWARRTPLRATSMTLRGLTRKVRAWPAAGASTMMRSAARQPLQLLDLAEHQDVLDAGSGGGDDLDHPAVGQLLGQLAEAVAVHVLDEGDVGSEGSGPDVRAPAPARRSRGSPSAPRAATRPLLASTATISTERPAAAPILASAAETVVLPTPPFPATMTTRDWLRNSPGSTPSADYLPPFFSSGRWPPPAPPACTPPSPRTPGPGRHHRGQGPHRPDRRRLHRTLAVAGAGRRRRGDRHPARQPGLAALAVRPRRAAVQGRPLVGAGGGLGRAHGRQGVRRGRPAGAGRRRRRGWHRPPGSGGRGGIAELTRRPRRPWPEGSSTW